MQKSTIIAQIILILQSQFAGLLLKGENIMENGISFVSTLVPLTLLMVIGVIKKLKTKVKKEMTDDDFVYYIPNFVSLLGFTASLVTLGLVIMFVFSGQELHPIFFIFFGGVFFYGLYLVIFALKYKIVIKNNNLTVYSLIFHPYTIKFEDIVSAKRKLDNNKYNTEKTVIKTRNGKRFKIDSTGVSYYRLISRIKNEVNEEYLIGFEDLDE